MPSLWETRSTMKIQELWNGTGRREGSGCNVLRKNGILAFKSAQDGMVFTLAGTQGIGLFEEG